jgi:hypothetical protein
MNNVRSDGSHHVRESKKGELISGARLPYTKSFWRDHLALGEFGVDRASSANLMFKLSAVQSTNQAQEGVLSSTGHKLWDDM